MFLTVPTMFLEGLIDLLSVDLFSRLILLDAGNPYAEGGRMKYQFADAEHYNMVLEVINIEQPEMVCYTADMYGNIEINSIYTDGGATVVDQEPQQNNLDDDYNDNRTTVGEVETNEEAEEETDHVEIPNEYDNRVVQIPEHDINNIIIHESENPEISIASVMNSDVTSTAKVLSDKIDELNSLMSKVINLQRDISSLSSGVSDNPIIKSIISQIDKMNNNENNLIERAYIGRSGDICILTRDIVTDVTEYFHLPAFVGKFFITINTKALFGLISDNENVCTIKNISVNYHYDNSVYEAAHIRNGKICFGNAYSTLCSTFANVDLLSTVEVLIRFLKNPNCDDPWGRVAEMYVMQ